MKTFSSICNDEITYNHLSYPTPKSDSKNFVQHVHNKYEIIYFLNGDATYIIEGKSYKLKPYDLIIIKPSKYHCIQIDGDVEYERYNILFPTEMVGEGLLSKVKKGTDVFNCQGNTLINELFRKMDTYSDLGEDVIIDLLPGLTKELFYNLVNLFDENISEPVKMSMVVSKAIKYINTNLFTIDNIEEISRVLFITPTYFFRIFKDEMKISPKKYITVKRLMEAQKRIHAGEKPTDVYLQCGFNTYTAFYKRYINYFGTPPSKSL